MHMGLTRKLGDEKVGDVGFTTPDQRPFILHAVSEIKLHQCERDNLEDFLTSPSFRLIHIGPTRKLGDEKLGDNSPRSPTSPRSLRFRPRLWFALKQLRNSKMTVYETYQKCHFEASGLNFELELQRLVTPRIFSRFVRFWCQKLIQNVRKRFS